MAKVVVFSGDHSRHLYVHSQIIEIFDEVLVICMKRENIKPLCPSDCGINDKKNFDRHFSERFEAEFLAFGNLVPETVFSNCSLYIVTPEDLCSQKICQVVANFRPDAAFVFGCDLIKPPLLNCLPDISINLHLGLSPWYRGSATLFWPFFMLEPQFAGVTFHMITASPDAGKIIHQETPILEYGDKIHDVAVRCVQDSVNSARLICERIQNQTPFKVKEQKTTGKIWRGSDFHPAQLRVIYDLFDNNIVDAYLNGELSERTPTTYSTFS